MKTEQVNTSRLSCQEDYYHDVKPLCMVQPAVSEPPNSLDFQLLAECGPDTIVHCGLDMQVNYISSSCYDLLGLTSREIIQHGSRRLVIAEDLSTLQEACKPMLAGGNPKLNATFRALHRNGSIVWIEAHGSVVHNRLTKTPIGVIIALRNVTTTKLLEQQLSRMAFIDGLTGLANRRAFDTSLEQAWYNMQITGAPMSLLLLDLDHFKSFNDYYGHQVGDDCLRSVAAVLEQSACHPSHVAARYGGEELALVLPNADSCFAAEVANDVRLRIEALQLPHKANTEGGGWVTVSIGLATALRRAGGTVLMPHGLLTAADTALYKAKRQGRNQVVGSLLLVNADRCD